MLIHRLLVHLVLRELPVIERRYSADLFDDYFVLFIIFDPAIKLLPTQTVESVLAGVVLVLI